MKLILIQQRKEQKRKCNIKDLSQIKATCLLEILKVSNDQDQINDIATELGRRMSEIPEVQDTYKRALGYKKKVLVKRRYRDKKEVE